MKTNTKTIEVRTKEIPKNMALRSGGMLAGLVIIGISVVFILTIILAIPGIFGLLIGFLVMYAGIPKEPVECTACGESFRVKVNDKSPKCETCETVNPIKWVKAVKAAK